MPDETSFDAFYRASRQRLFACLYALTADAAEAQDVVHEAYARAWQAGREWVTTPTRKRGCAVTLRSYDTVHGRADRSGLLALAQRAAARIS